MKNSAFNILFTGIVGGEIVYWGGVAVSAMQQKTTSGRNGSHPWGRRLSVPKHNWQTNGEIQGEVADSVTPVDPENALSEILNKLGKGPSCAT